MIWKILFGLFIIAFLIGVGGFAYYVNEKTQNWGSLDTLFLTNEPINTTTPKLNFNFLQNTAPTLEFVSATEYSRGDGTGSTIVKLTDWKGDKINTTCYEQIFYPDKSIYVNWTVMLQHWEYGNYYMDFNVPLVLGIYDQEVRCYVGGKNISIGKGFHVGNLTDMINSNTDELKVDMMTVDS